MVDLLPCPFCGSTNLRYEFAGSQGYIECNECGTQGPCDERAADPHCDTDAAYEAWNRRAALARPEPEGPTDEELVRLAREWNSGYESVELEFIADFARAVLARWGRSDGPAVPNGREPASVNVEPSDDELFRHFTGACKWLPGGDVEDDVIVYGLRAVLARWGRPAPQPADGEVAAEARAALAESERIDPELEKAAAGVEAQLLPWRDRDAALAQSEPEGPTDEDILRELIDIADEAILSDYSSDVVDAGRRLLARWGTPNSAEIRRSLGDALQPVPVSERLPEPSVKVLAHYFNALGKGRTICAIWVPAKSRSDEGDLDADNFLEYDEENDKYHWPEGWYEAIENWEEFGWIQVYEGEIAYWQPLPQWPTHALPVPTSGEVEGGLKGSKGLVSEFGPNEMPLG